MKIDSEFLWGSKLTKQVASDAEEMQRYYDEKLGAFRILLHRMRNSEKALSYIVRNGGEVMSTIGAILNMANEMFTDTKEITQDTYPRFYSFKLLTPFTADDMINDELLKEAKEMLEDLNNGKSVRKAFGKAMIAIACVFAVAVIILLSILAFQGYGNCGI